MMTDPVIDSDGNTYERAAIEKYFEEHGFVSPLTGKTISEKLIPNRSLQELIRMFNIQRSREKEKKTIATILSQVKSELEELYSEVDQLEKKREELLEGLKAVDQRFNVLMLKKKQMEAQLEIQTCRLHCLREGKDAGVYKIWKYLKKIKTKLDQCGSQAVFSQKSIFVSPNPNPNDTNKTDNNDNNETDDNETETDNDTKPTSIKKRKRAPPETAVGQQAAKGKKKRKLGEKKQLQVNGSRRKGEDAGTDDEGVSCMEATTQKYWKDEPGDEEEEEEEEDAMEEEKEEEEEEEEE
eukprot:CAMPEP_0174270128 /NCGR_PEP_ID=MMETSP0439-20130205/43430_1 /TAXON_ID=0 /ORGANISM="Stereomyxa ramosa, Strain Chinc5" /LENGTH=295 /DNA_ID=CAMNT_0015359287 /DNA_START=54 /DNA_END=938 /DNA_ORIENTATION=-